MRKKYLDAAKGIGILFVLINHSCGFPIGGGFITGFYMPLFFIISGMTHKDGRSISENISRRFALIKKYFLYSTLLLIISAIVYHWNGKNMIRGIFGILYSRKYINVNIQDNLMIANNSPLWFLTAMFTASFIFYVFLDRLNYKNTKKMVIGSTLLIVVTYGFSKLPFLMPWSIDTAFLSAFFLLVGFAMQSVYAKVKCHGIGVGVLVIVYTISFIANDGVVNYSIRQYGNYGLISILLFTISGISGSLLLIKFCEQFENSVFMKMMQSIGKNTLPILAFHVVVYGTIDYILKEIGISTLTGSAFFAVGYLKVCIAVFASVGIYRLLCRIPKAQKFL